MRFLNNMINTYRYISNFLENNSMVKRYIHLFLYIIIIGMSIFSILMIKSYYDNRIIREKKLNDLKITALTKEINEQSNIVNQALNDLRNHKPVTQTTEVHRINTIQYVEKNNPDDPDVVVNTSKTAKVKYNDQVFDVPIKTTKGSTQKDGTVVLTQNDQIEVDITKMANRQIAAYDLMRDKAEQDLKDDLEKEKKKNRDMKKTMVSAAAGGLMLYYVFKK